MNFVFGVGGRAANAFAGWHFIIAEARQECRLHGRVASLTLLIISYFKSFTNFIMAFYWVNTQLYNTGLIYVHIIVLYKSYFKFKSYYVF